jgi:hypothetical protein
MKSYGPEVLNLRPANVFCAAHVVLLRRSASPFAIKKQLPRELHIIAIFIKE